MSNAPLSAGAKGENAGPVPRENAASVKSTKSVDTPLTRSQIDTVGDNLASIFGEDAPSGEWIPIFTTRPTRAVFLLRECPLPLGYDEVQYCKNKQDPQTRKKKKFR